MFLKEEEEKLKIRKSPEKQKRLKRDAIEINLFKKSIYYKTLKEADGASQSVEFKFDDGTKIELDSDQGQESAKKLLKSIEKLFMMLEIKREPRSYR